MSSARAVVELNLQVFRTPRHMPPFGTADEPEVFGIAVIACGASNGI